MSRISPLRQAGSWQLKDWLVVVEKTNTLGGTLGLHVYNVEIEGSPAGKAVSTFERVEASEPCIAAALGVVVRFGRWSEEAAEFRTHYPCGETGRGMALGPRRRAMKLDFDDDGGGLSGGVYADAEEFLDRVYGPIRRNLTLDFDDGGEGISGLPSWAQPPRRR